MAEVLNIHALHDNGEAKVQIGLRNNAFVIGYDDLSKKITITDAVTGEALDIDGVAMTGDVPNVTISDVAPTATTPGKPKDIYIVYNTTGSSPVSGLWVMNNNRLWLKIV